MKMTTASHKHIKRGTITHEAVMAIVVATAAIVGTAQILAVVAHQRRDVERQSVAIHEAGNLLEEIAARRWSELTQQELSAMALSDECRDVLREPRLRITVLPGPAPAGAGKHIAVEIDWLVSQDQRSLPLRLVTWRYPPGEPEQ